MSPDFMKTINTCQKMRSEIIHGNRRLAQNKNNKQASGKNMIISELEDEIEKGYRIIFYDLDNEDILNLLCNAVNTKNLSDIEIWCQKADRKNPPSYLRIVTENEMSEILDIYHLYEFSDKLVVLSDNPIYPSILNYIHQGLLTENEVVEALVR